MDLIIQTDFSPFNRQVLFLGKQFAVSQAWEIPKKKLRYTHTEYHRRGFPSFLSLPGLAQRSVYRGGGGGGKKSLNVRSHRVSFFSFFRWPPSFLLSLRECVCSIPGRNPPPSTPLPPSPAKQPSPHERTQSTQLTPLLSVASPLTKRAKTLFSFLFPRSPFGRPTDLFLTVAPSPSSSA